MTLDQWVDLAIQSPKFTKSYWRGLVMHLTKGSVSSIIDLRINRKDRTGEFDNVQALRDLSFMRDYFRTSRSGALISIYQQNETPPKASNAVFLIDLVYDQEKLQTCSVDELENTYRHFSVQLKTLEEEFSRAHDKLEEYVRLDEPHIDKNKPISIDYLYDKSISRWGDNRYSDWLLSEPYHAQIDDPEFGKQALDRSHQYINDLLRTVFEDFSLLKAQICTLLSDLNNDTVQSLRDFNSFSQCFSKYLLVLPRSKQDTNPRAPYVDKFATTEWDPLGISYDAEFIKTCSQEVLVENYKKFHGEINETMDQLCMAYDNFISYKADPTILEKAHYDFLPQYARTR
jgi:hypothetical protein